MTLKWPFKVITGHIGAIVYLGYGFLFIINSRHGSNMHRLPLKGYWKLHDLEMIFQGHHRSYIGAIVYLGYGFLFVINSRHGPNRHRFPSKGNWKSHDLDMTFQGHHRSYLLTLMETLGMVSYLSLIVTMCLTGTTSKLQHHLCFLS